MDGYKTSIHHFTDIFMGTQETIIYRLVLKNPGFGPYLLFWPKIGGCPHSYPYWSGALKPDQKVDPLGGPFGSSIV